MCFLLEMSPSTKLKNSGPPANFEETETNYKRKVELRQTEDAGIDDAVKLAIAASEALVINELLRIEPLFEGLETGSILEAALRVKQARLESCECVFHCQSEELDAMDSLSELDDSIMLDAFLDVGLLFTCHADQYECAAYAAAVKGLPEPETQYVQESGFDCLQLMAQHKKAYGDLGLCLKSSNISDDPTMQKGSAESSPVVPVTQPNDDLISLHACFSQKYGENKLHFTGTDRFQSCWLGGWTVKEGSASIKPKKNGTNSIRQMFVRETSFLSESLDIAPDENSFAQNQETEHQGASQPSVPFEGVCFKNDEGVTISQEVRSYDISLFDPLCSVVPCSISSQNATSPVHDEIGFDGKTCFPISKLVTEVLRASDLNAGSMFPDAKAMSFIGDAGELIKAPVRRHLNSLRTYSTLCTDQKTSLDVGRLFPFQCIGSSDGRASKGFFPSVFESERFGGGNIKNNQEADVASISVAQMPMQETCNALVKDVADMHDNACLPFLDPGTSSSPQDSTFSVGNVTGDEDHIKAAAQETKIVRCEKKTLHQTKMNPQTPSIPKNLTRKRVLFSEFEFNQQKVDLKYLPTSQRKFPLIRANKRWKQSNSWSKSYSHGLNGYSLSRLKDDKRLIFHGVDFLLTGFSKPKETEIMRRIQEFGGIVLSDIPTPPSSRVKSLSRSHFQKLPIVISSKKLQTAKFLFGCAVNSLILKLKWITDSIAAGYMLPPGKYMILSHQASLKYLRSKKLLFCGDHECIFDKIGILLHGKHNFYTKFATIIKHGGGQVFKTLQRLLHSLDKKIISVGAIVAEDQSRAIRHLKQCASERRIPMMPASWIAKSLHLGQLLPFKEDESATLTKRIPEVTIYSDWSQEI